MPSLSYQEEEEEEEEEQQQQQAQKGGGEGDYAVVKWRDWKKS
jgi:hypothetical protein